MVKVTNLVITCTDKVNFIFLEDALLCEAIRKRWKLFSWKRKQNKTKKNVGNKHMGCEVPIQNKINEMFETILQRPETLISIKTTIMLSPYSKFLNIINCLSILFKDCLEPNTFSA